MNTASSDNPRAIALFLVAWFLYTAEIVGVKALGGVLPLAQVLLLRFGVQLCFMSVYAAFNPGIVRTRRLKAHAGRSLASLAVMTCQYAAFAVLPLALATTLSFSQGFFVVILAALVLREAVGRARLLTTVLGFVGVVVACRPVIDHFDPMILVMLLGSLFGSAVMLTTKSLARSDGPATIMFYVGWFNALGVALPALWLWQAPTASQLALMVTIALLGSISNVFMILAFRLGDASALAPLDPIRLVFATAAGVALFSEAPDFWTVLGAAIIIASTLALARAERSSR
jgi:drug/metabolite transporter (DMT)-like permease